MALIGIISDIATKLNIIILSMTDPTYKSKMYEHFKKIGLDDLPPGRAKEVSENIIQELKGEHGSEELVFFKAINRTSKRYYAVEENEALKSKTFHLYQLFVSLICSNNISKCTLTEIKSDISKRNQSYDSWSTCKVCFKGCDNLNLLQCDSCDQFIHTYCLTPPLEAVPDEKYFVCGESMIVQSCLARVHVLY